MLGETIVNREGCKPLLVLPIKQAPPTGVFKGLSYYQSWLECRRKKVLERQIGGTSSIDARIGIYLHKLLEIYYRGDWDKYAVECEKPSDPEWREALRLFNAYREIYPSNEWTVDATELVVNYGASDREEPKLANYIEGSALLNYEDDMNSWYAKRETCRAKYGVPEIGSIIDMVVTVSEENISTLVKKRLFPANMEPGRYIADHKSKKQRDTNMEVTFFRQIQFTLYQMLCEDDPRIGPVKGCIANALVRHVKLEDKKSFVTTLVPPLSQQDRNFVKSTLTKCHDQRQYHKTRGEESPANPQWCDMFGGCAMLGICDRI